MISEFIIFYIIGPCARFFNFIQKWFVFLYTVLLPMDTGFVIMRKYSNNSAKFMEFWFKVYYVMWVEDEKKLIGGKFVASDYPFDQIEESLFPSLSETCFEKNKNEFCEKKTSFEKDEYLKKND